MFKVDKVEVIPLKDRFGIQHKIYINGGTEFVKSALKRYSSAQDLTIEGNVLEIKFPSSEKMKFLFEKPLEDYYTEEVHTAWKEMVAEALGMEEPFRYYSFYSPEGEHLGTVGFKQDCENATPIILVYQNF